MKCGRCGRTYGGHLLACRGGKVSPHVYQGYVSWDEMERTWKAVGLTR